MLGLHEEKQRLVADETRVSLMWWAVCFARVDCGVGGRSCSRKEDILHLPVLFFCPVICLCLFGAVSRAVTVEGVVVTREAIVFMYVPCWANISDHRGVECLATIISPYQVHMHVPFTCARTGGVETRGDCEHGHRCDLRQEVLQFAPQSFVMSVHNPQQQTIGARRPVSCPRFG